MEEKKIQEELLATLNILKPTEEETHNKERTLEESLAYLRVVAQYVMLDKEASCRESYELGKSQGGK